MEVMWEVSSSTSYGPKQLEEGIHSQYNPYLEEIIDFPWLRANKRS